VLYSHVRIENQDEADGAVVFCASTILVEAAEKSRAGKRRESESRLLCEQSQVLLENLLLW